MDFEKTRFSVDWFTPGDKRLSFPKSACFSIDDLVHVSDTPLSLCFTPVDEHAHANPKTCGWLSSAPASPLSPTAVATTTRDSHDADHDDDHDVTAAVDWRALASPGLVDIADDCASCGVDLDVTCLRALDEQLILAPVDCFTELCWAAAVQDDVHARFVRKKKHRGRHPVPLAPRARARSCKPDAGRRAAWREEAVETPLPEPGSLPGRGYPGSFELERVGPLAAKIARQCDMSPPSSPHAYERSRTYEEEPGAYVLYADPKGHADTRARDVSTRHAKKRDWTLMPAPLRLPPTPVLKTSPPSPTFRVGVSDLVPFRKRSPLVVSTP